MHVINECSVYGYVQTRYIKKWGVHFLPCLRKVSISHFGWWHKWQAHCQLRSGTACEKCVHKSMDWAKQLRELDLLNIWQRSNFSLPVKQETGDHSLPSLKSNPHLEGINVKWFGFAYPSSLNKKKRDKIFHKVTEIKNLECTSLLRELKCRYCKSDCVDTLNVIKIALSEVTALNKNLWIWTWIIHPFQIISV